MTYFGAALTDIGIKKNTNQDCIAVKIAESDLGQVAFLIICDGMGGLEQGEVASATVITRFSNWFEEQFPFILQTGLEMDRLKEDWRSIINRVSIELDKYGTEKNIKLGTTLTAMLIYNGKYYIVHVGDSRAYELGDEVKILTEDQTFVAREIKLGRMTPEEAMQDSRRNVLLQCIGASSVVEPAFYEGEVSENVVYMVCSDGFRHVITSEEINGYIGRDVVTDVESSRRGMSELIRINKERLEEDNISVALVKVI